jgi:hypothetical protein
LWKFRKRITPDMRLERFTFSKIGNLEQPYPAYRELVKKRFPEKMDDAFGAAGDIDIAEFRPTPEKLLSFHQEAERLEAARRAEERAKESETAWSRPRMRC